MRLGLRDGLQFELQTQLGTRFASFADKITTANAANGEKRICGSIKNAIRSLSNK
jgi:hypothetical protein